MAKHALISFIIILIHTSIVVSAAPTNNPVSTGFPMWTIALIIVIVCLLIILGILYTVWKRRSRVKDKAEENKHEDLSSSRLAGQSTIAADPLDEKHSRNDIGVIVEDSKHEDDFHISLPLPPMTASLFSDKFELSEQAVELYKKYMYEEQKQQQQKQPRLSIRGTLRKSMRKASTAPKKQSANRLQNLFSEPSHPSIPASKETQPTPNTVTEEKVALEEPANVENPSMNGTEKEHEQQSKQREKDPKQESVPPTPVSAESAARLVILDASVRSKRRSVIPTAEHIVSVGEKHEKEKSPESSSADQIQEKTKELTSLGLPRNPSVQDIINWWQKESSVCNSPSNSSLGSLPRSQAEPTASEQNENEPEKIDSMVPIVEQTPPATLRGALSLNQSVEKESIAERKSGEERVTLGSLASRNSSVGIATSIRNSVASRASSISIRGNNLLLRAQQQPAMAAVFAGEDNLEAPVPTASFSSSTVRTVIPADEYNERKPNTVKEQSIKKQQSQQQQQSKAQKQQAMERKKNVTCTTVRKQQAQQRGSIPWMHRNVSQGKTPAQRERDRYLQSQK